MLSSADAQTECTRRQTLRGVRRRRWEVVVPVDGLYAAPDMGNVIKITQSRFGLSGGKLFIVLGIEPNAARREARLTIWG